MIKRRESSNVKEGFEDKPVENFPNITFCPFNSTAVMTSSGETLCCQGESSRKLGCLEKTVCSLSNSQGKDYGPCSKVYGEYIKKMSQRCPWPRGEGKQWTYFEKRDTGNNDIVTEKGCYEGPTNPNKYEPVSPEQKKCIMYNSQKDNDMNIDSCWNQRVLALRSWQIKKDYQLPNATVKYVQENKKFPPLLSVTSMVKQQSLGAQMEMPETSYTGESVVRYWKVVWPEYKKYNIDALTAEQLKFIFEINLNINNGRINPKQKGVWSQMSPMFEKYGQQR